MNAHASETRALLQRWHGGDREALDRLLERDLGWIRDHVSRRLGDALRGKAETQDFVQDAVVEVLRYSPRFVIEDRDRFRGLLVRIVENVLRDRNDWFHAKRRELAREQPLPSGSVLELGDATTPSQAAGRRESEAWLRLGLELLDADDRRVILLRQWDDLEFAEVGDKLGVTEDAARMRFNRALRRLASAVGELRQGRVPGQR